MNVWWSRSPRPGNFGDILTPHILGAYGIRAQWSELSTASAISTGSIVRFARRGMQVLGSGAMWRTDAIEPRAVYRWVRGPLTGLAVSRAGGDCPEVYGDPAMLLPRVFPRDTEAVHEVGIVPHYVDAAACEKYPVVINPLNADPLAVLRGIWACKRVVSSSLHGIIAAHSYGIPAAWVRFSDKLDGDGTKFHDHALAVGLDGMPLSTVDEPEFTVARYDDSAIDAILLGLGAD
jgi:hypothetical protein